MNGQSKRVRIVQPVVPDYRVPFFEALARKCDVIVYGSRNFPGAAPHTAQNPLYLVELPSALRIPIIGLFWQRGIPYRDLLSANVVVLDGNVRVLSTWVILIVSRIFGVRVVWWTHANINKSRRPIQVLRLRIMRWVDCVALYTECEAEAIREIPKMRRANIVAINNTIDDRAIKKAKSAHADIKNRRKFGLTGNESPERYLLFCGRVTEKAKLDLAIRALAELETVKIGLVVIGDGEHRYNCECLAEALGVANRIRWLGSISDEYEKAPWFRDALAFIYPGNIGLSALHALHYGVPVVTHNNIDAHMPEICALKEGVNALLFDEGNATSVRKSIEVVLEWPSYRRQLAVGAERTANDRWRLSQMVNNYMRAIGLAIKRQ